MFVLLPYYPCLEYSEIYNQIKDPLLEVFSISSNIHFQNYTLSKCYAIQINIDIHLLKCILSEYYIS